MSPYDRVRTDVLMMSARRVLKQARRKLPLRNRADALAIIRGLRPPIPRSVPLVAQQQQKDTICTHCKRPILFGEPVAISWDGSLDYHINCNPKGNK